MSKSLTSDRSPTHICDQNITEIQSYPWSLGRYIEGKGGEEEIFRLSQMLGLVEKEVESLGSHNRPPRLPPSSQQVDALSSRDLRRRTPATYSLAGVPASVSILQSLLRQSRSALHGSLDQQDCSVKSRDRIPVPLFVNRELQGWLPCVP